MLPDGAELVKSASAEGGIGLALREWYRVPVAYAFLDELGRRPLQAAEQRALRVVLDPALLVTAASHVGVRDGSLAVEVLPLWRRDLPMPAVFATLVQGSVAERLELAAALGHRRSRRALLTLADLLLDADPGVRTAASVSLFQSLGDRIAYDPEWPESRRLKAAETLRKLHNQGR